MPSRHPKKGNKSVEISVKVGAEGSFPNQKCDSIVQIRGMPRRNTTIARRETVVARSRHCIPSVFRKRRGREVQSKIPPSGHLTSFQRFAISSRTLLTPVFLWIDLYLALCFVFSRLHSVDSRLKSPKRLSGGRAPPCFT